MPEMKIGTARPDESEMQGVPHHLLGFLSPSERFSVADYVELSRKCIEEIHSRGKLPIIAGGTGLYVRSLLRGIQFCEMPENPALRKQLEEESERDPVALWEKLQQVDEEAARNIHPNNRKRVIRALEVYLLTGEPFSQQSKEAAQGESPYRWAMLCLGFHQREVLYERINRRVDMMMEQGWWRKPKPFSKSIRETRPSRPSAIRSLRPISRGEIPGRSRREY